MRFQGFERFTMQRARALEIVVGYDNAARTIQRLISHYARHGTGDIR